jgi:hypothetical protein
LETFEPDLHLPVPSGHRARVLLVEPLVNVGIALPRLIRQEHAFYGDVVVLFGESGGEQLSVLGVLVVLHVLHELPDGDLVFLLNRVGVHHSLLSI